MGTFKRVEKKYLINKELLEALLTRLGDRVTSDEFGLHAVCNLYFDDDDNDLIRRSIDKPPFKEKIRLRSYGIPSDEEIVFLEIKKKYHGTVYKRRVRIPYKVAMEYIINGIYPKDFDCQILREIDYSINYYKVKPSIYLAYDRIGYYVVDNPDIRFTVDSNIRSRRESLTLSNDDGCKMLFDDNDRLMEIKAENALPQWFVEALNELKIYPMSFSKYGMIYKTEKVGQVVDVE